MDLITTAGQFLFGTLVPFLVILTVVVFIHELGHFLVARWCGVKVATFSIGFGPELFGFGDRHGTRWRFAAIPLGGYVKFIDDENAASLPRKGEGDMVMEGGFQTASLPRRAAIVVAGPVANFILAIVVFTALFASLGKPISAPFVSGVLKESAAEAAGFQPGDLIVSIDGEAMRSFSDVARIAERSPEVPLTIVVERDGETVTLSATPKLDRKEDIFGNVYRAGILGIQHEARNVETVSYTPLAAFRESLAECWSVVRTMLGYLGGVIIGREAPDQIGGIIGIAHVSGQAAELGFIPFINLIAFLSISIGLLNLFPIPLLDGGHLVYYAIEAVRGKPLSERAQEYGFRIGLVIVLALLVFGATNDIIRLASG